MSFPIPQWIYEMNPEIYAHAARLERALEIAWDTLQHIEGNCECCPDDVAIGRLATETMKRIDNMAPESTPNGEKG